METQFIREALQPRPEHERTLDSLSMNLLAIGRHPGVFERMSEVATEEVQAPYRFSTKTTEGGERVIGTLSIEGVEKPIELNFRDDILTSFSQPDGRIGLYPVY